MLIRGGTFIVTGAGSGLGAATARMLVENGARVVIADLNDTAGEAIAAELGTDACYIKADVTSAEDGASRRGNRAGHLRREPGS